MKIETKLIPFFGLILLIPLTSYGQQTGILEIDLKSMGGEMTDYHGTALKIYQNNGKIPFIVIDSLSGNPYKISLPIGYQYKVEVYASSMYANVGYVNLQNNNEKLELVMPNPGSILFTAVYNDGATPINNATVIVKSGNGTYEYWTPSTTNEDGDTVRFWLQPTITNDDHYVANISVGNNLSYSYSPVTILPGKSNNAKIITPWPSVAPPLVASIYKSQLQKISKDDGNFVVRLYDNNENKVSESKVDFRGEAYFSNLKVGSYVLRVIDLNDDNNSVWGVANVIDDGKQTAVQIFKNQTNNNILNKSQDVSISDSELLSDVGIKANHIPSWMINNAKWVIDGKITKQDFVNAVMYLHTSGIIT